MTLKQNKLLSFNLDKILVKTFVLFINNGICNENSGLCDCYRDNENGYWKNPDVSGMTRQCSVCYDDYY